MIVFEQVLILLVFVGAGFLLGKYKITDSKHAGIISKLLVYVFIPSNIFRTFAKNFNREYIVGNYEFVISSTIILLVLVPCIHYVAKLFSKKKYERGVYEYSLIVSNYGNMGYPLVETLFGQTGLLNYMVFAIPVSLYTYTIGYSILTKREVSLKGLLNPVVIATALGMTVGMLQLTLPSFVIIAADKASACMAPVSMLLTGIVVSEFDIREVLADKRLYPVILLRLIVIPVAIGKVIGLLFSKTIVDIAVMFYCLPCGMNAVVFPKFVDENCEIGAGLTLVSTIVSLISITAVFYIFSIGF